MIGRKAFCFFGTAGLAGTLAFAAVLFFAETGLAGAFSVLTLAVTVFLSETLGAFFSGFWGFFSLYV